MPRQKQVQVEWKPVGRRPAQGWPAVTTATAAIRGPVSSSVAPQMTTSMGTPLPMSSSTVVTTLSSAITSMVMAVQAEHSLSTVCSEMGPSQLMNGIGGTAETITLVPEDLIHGADRVAGALPKVAVLRNQGSCGTTPGGTEVQDSIMVARLRDALQTVNAGRQHSDPATRTDDSMVQSLLQCIWQLESASAENVMLHQWVIDLETQAYQAQHLVTVHQKQETGGSDDPVEIGAMNGLAKHKKKWQGKSGKKSCFAVDVLSSSQSSVETSDSDSEGDTEALLSTSSQKRCRAPRSGRLVPPFIAKRESWTVWFARFQAIADDNDWSGPERLSMLLPKLQGAAGEYVFKVLPKRIRSDYRKLVRELDACYCKVESKQNYRRQLTGISQKPGESEQELAAELKRLYDKAYLN